MTTKWWFYLGQVNIDSLIHVLWKTIEVNLSRPRRHFPCTRLTKRLFQVLSEHAQIGVGWGLVPNPSLLKNSNLLNYQEIRNIRPWTQCGKHNFPLWPPTKPHHTPNPRGISRSVYAEPRFWSSDAFSRSLQWLFLSCLNYDKSHWGVTTESGLEGYRIPCLTYHVKDYATDLKVRLQQMTRMIVLGTKMFVG